ncbi:MAG TPA: DsbA family protein [Solirubrobacteraceae bacterium]
MLAILDHHGMPENVPWFFLGAMSPYSWFAAERIADVLAEARWRGVLAGAVFKANDRVSWGLTERREQGMADCEARAKAHGLGPIRWPEPWPTSDLLVARAMVFAEFRGVLERFALSAMRLCFLEGQDLGEMESVLASGERVGIERAELETAIADREIKDRLRAQTDEVLALGVFGVPTVVVGTELFWGDDRLEDAAASYRAAS